jgi:hypothetical protein
MGIPKQAASDTLPPCHCEERRGAAIPIHPPSDRRAPRAASPPTARQSLPVKNENLCPLCPGDDDDANEAYDPPMHTFLTVLIGILMLATLAVLLAAMVGMVREGNPRRSNKLMQWRVLLQGATILLFMILMSLLRS